MKIPACDVQRYGPGEAVASVEPGDFILTHSDAWTNRMIGWGQRFRYRGALRGFAHWSHTAVLVDSEGTLIEAVEAGVQQRNISVYRGTEYHVVHLREVAEMDRRHAVAFAHSCLIKRYGYLTDVSIALTLLTGSGLYFGLNGQIICSSLVARALERMGAVFPRDPWMMLPADLACAFNVTPAPGADRGQPPDAGAGVMQRSERGS